MTTGIGETLHDAREQRGRTLEDVARSLRLRTEQVRALEEERFASFGGDVYARGFLKSYAAEVGLDPEPLLDTYRREVSGDEPLVSPLVTPGAAGTVRPRRGAPPGWIVWILGAVVILAVVAAIGQIAGGRTPDVASPDAPPPAPADTDDGDTEGSDPDGTETDGTETDGGTDPDEGDAREDPDDDGGTDEPDPEPTFDGVELLLALEEDSWMRVTVDGAVVYEQLASQGETLPFSGDEVVTVRYGNAGGVRVEFNGEDLGSPGGRGDVVDVEYTPEFGGGDV